MGKRKITEECITLLNKFNIPYRYLKLLNYNGEYTYTVNDSINLLNILINKKSILIDDNIRKLIQINLNQISNSNFIEPVIFKEEEQMRINLDDIDEEEAINCEDFNYNDIETVEFKKHTKKKIRRVDKNLNILEINKENNNKINKNKTQNNIANRNIRKVRHNKVQIINVKETKMEEEKLDDKIVKEKLNDKTIKNSKVDDKNINNVKSRKSKVTRRLQVIEIKTVENNKMEEEVNKNDNEKDKNDNKEIHNVKSRKSKVTRRAQIIKHEINHENEDNMSEDIENNSEDNNKKE